jgi:RNA polymerase sigma-70 factor, ECF subfamily
MGASNTLMTRNVDDLSLVEACRAGRTEAYGLLVQRCQDRLYPTILRLMGSHEDAQDVLQDAFIRGFEKLDQYHGDSSFYTWIYRIAVNLALSRHRKRRMHGILRLWSSRRDDPVVDPPDPSPGADPSSSTERAEREAAVAAALDELAPDQRAVVVLKDFDGRRYEEISEILSVPVGTVRSRLHRARCQLRDRLRSLVEDEEPARPSVESVTS